MNKHYATLAQLSVLCLSKRHNHLNPNNLTGRDFARHLIHATPTHKTLWRRTRAPAVFPFAISPCGNGHLDNGLERTGLSCGFAQINNVR